MTPNPATGDKRVIRAWCLYDFGNSAFAVLFPVVFAVFFADTVVGDAGGRGDTLWALLTSASMLIVAVGAPFLGGVADHSGARKKLFVIGTAIGIACVLGFSALGPGTILLGFVLGALANVAFEGAGVFYNAYLPDIAPPERHGRVSGQGFAVGYAGSLVALGMSALLIQFGWGAFIWTALALQWALASVPALRYLPADEPTGQTLLEAGMNGLKGTGKTIREVWAMQNLRRYLIAYLIYMDGVHTVVIFAALYAKGTLGFSSTELCGMIGVMQITALIGALLSAAPTDRLGPRRVVGMLLVWWTLVVIAAYLAPTKVAFVVVGGLAGLGLGSIQSASRAFMSRLIPEGRESELFGFYALCGKSGAILGPLVFAGVAVLFGGDRRPAVLAVSVFFLVGAYLLRHVHDRPARAEPRPEPS